MNIQELLQGNDESRLSLPDILHIQGRLHRQGIPIRQPLLQKLQIIFDLSLHLSQSRLGKLSSQLFVPSIGLHSSPLLHVVEDCPGRSRRIRRLPNNLERPTKMQCVLPQMPDGFQVSGGHGTLQGTLDLRVEDAGHEQLLQGVHLLLEVGLRDGFLQLDQEVVEAAANGMQPQTVPEAAGFAKFARGLVVVTAKPVPEQSHLRELPTHLLQQSEMLHLNCILSHTTESRVARVSS